MKYSIVLDLKRILQALNEIEGRPEKYGIQLPEFHEVVQLLKRTLSARQRRKRESFC